MHCFYIDFTRKHLDIEPSEHAFTEQSTGMPREAESVIEPGLQVYCLVRYKSINVSGDAVYQTVFLGPEACPEDLA
jgi:hypothetical protein